VIGIKGLTAFAGLPNFLFQGTTYWLWPLLSNDFGKMGNDGGSIPDRRDLVKTKPKVHFIRKLHTLILTSEKSRPNKPTKQTRRELVGSSAHCQRYVIIIFFTAWQGS